MGGALDHRGGDWFAQIVQHGLDLAAGAGTAIDARGHQQAGGAGVVAHLSGLPEQGKRPLGSA